MYKSQVELHPELQCKKPVLELVIHPSLLIGLVIGCDELDGNLLLHAREPEALLQKDEKSHLGLGNLVVCGLVLQSFVLAGHVV